MPAFPNGGEEVVVPQRAARASVWSGPYFDVFILKNKQPRPQPQQTHEEEKKKNGESTVYLASPRMARTWRRVAANFSGHS